MKVLNKKASFEYTVHDTVEAGIVLTGAEVKAVRAKKVDLGGAYVRPVGGEMFLINAHIGVPGEEHARARRKLLLNKKEILSLSTKAKAQKLTLIPLSMYTKGPLVKVEVALARGKKTHEKRAQIAKRDVEREIERELRDKD